MENCLATRRTLRVLKSSMSNFCYKFPAVSQQMSQSAFKAGKQKSQKCVVHRILVERYKYEQQASVSFLNRVKPQYIGKHQTKYRWKQFSEGRFTSFISKSTRVNQYASNSILHCNESRHWETTYLPRRLIGINERINSSDFGSLEHIIKVAKKYITLCLQEWSR